jgi:heptosyltransferase-2
MNESLRERAPRRLVIRGVNWLGDAVMSTPALVRLREAHPEDFIALISPEKLADLWKNHPAIDEVLPLTPSDGLLGTARRIRSGRFDVGLVLPNSFRSAFELWWARVPERIGYAGQLRSWMLTQGLPHPSEAVRMHKRSRHEILALTTPASEPSGPLSHTLSESDNSQQSVGQSFLKRTCWDRPSLESPKLPSAAHHIHQYLRLGACLGASPIPLAPELFVTSDEVQAFLKKFEIPADPARPLFGLNPGAEYGTAKRWPADRFISAAQEIQRQTNCRWLIFGAKADIELAEQISVGIQSACNSVPKNRTVINLAGATSLRELCAGLKTCGVLLTNDTGPMHVAAAVGTPVVVPFGSTSAELTGPFPISTSRHQVLQSTVPCSPCFLRQCPIDFRCMQQISVAEVIAATLAATGA